MSKHEETMNDYLDNVRKTERELLMKNLRAHFYGASVNRIPRWLYLIVLVLGTLILTQVRFLNYYPDSEHYLGLVEIFRGNLPIYFAVPPFCYRPLLPLVAAIVPIDPTLTFGIVNILSCMALTVVTFFIVSDFGINDFGAFCGAGLTTISAPTILYGSAILVDAPVMFLMALFLLGTKREWGNHRLAYIMIVGVLFKETMIVVGVIYILILFYSYERTKPAILITGLGVYLYVWTRFTFGLLGVNATWIWGWNHLWNITNNLEMVVRTVVFSLMFIIPAIIIGITLRNRDEPKFGKTVVWLIFTGLPFFGLMLVGFFMAYFDMRFIWPLYLAMAPMAGYAAEQVMSIIRRKTGWS